MAVSKSHTNPMKIVYKEIKRKKIVSTLLIVALFFALDLAFTYLYFYFNINFNGQFQKYHWFRKLFSFSDFIIKFFLLFLLFVNMTYKSFFDFKSGKLKFALFMVISIIISIHAASRLNCIDEFYFYSKTLVTRPFSNRSQPDQLLSHKGIPNSQSADCYYIGDSIHGCTPIFFDSLGYRTVPDSLKLKNEKLDLYLGCSFTFGDYIMAEDSYPYLTSKLLKNNYINAGCGAYGLGQMKLLIDSLVGKYPFNYVFIQLSPWLSERSISFNGPVDYGYRSFPYFSDYGKSFKLNPPSYSTYAYSRKNWRETPPSYSEKIQFFLTDGLKIEIHDYYCYWLSRLKAKAGIIPEPTRRKESLEKYFYSYAINKCKKNNSTPIILKLKYPKDECRELLDYLSTMAKIIDLDADLDKKVTETNCSYETLFSIYYVNGNDSIIYDHHPNELANKLFSKRIYAELKDIKQD